MRHKKKRRIISLTLIFIALLLIIGFACYLVFSDKENKVAGNKVDTANEIDSKTDNDNSIDNDTEPSTPSEEDSTKDLFDKFLNGEIDADAFNEGEQEEYTLNVSELDIDGDDWNSSHIYGYIDVDNDDEDELVITNSYGAMLFDAKDGKVKMYETGGGTADTLLLAYYEDAYWVVHVYAGADCDEYSMYKYNGADTIEETFYFGCEIDENGTETYYKGNGTGEDIDITQEEYKELAGTILSFN